MGYTGDRVGSPNWSYLLDYRGDIERIKRNDRV
ncbi:hypothetical protein ES703_98189 [subsurface metagenome]